MRTAAVAFALHAVAIAAVIILGNLELRPLEPDRMFGAVLLFVLWAGGASFAAWRLYRGKGRRAALIVLSVPLFMGVTLAVHALLGGEVTKPPTDILYVDIALLLTWTCALISLLLSPARTK